MLWYAGYLLYDLGAALGLPHERRLQEDLVLLEAANAKDALAEAEEIGRITEESTQALIAGTPGKLREAGMEFLIPAFFPDGTPGEPAEASCAGQLCLPKRYEEFRFLGLRDLWVVGAELRHGTELDRWTIAESADLAALVTPEAGLAAFDPAGEAYSGDGRLAENDRLHREFKWYLAEQLFGDVRRVCEDGRLPGPGIARLVLICANSPDEAVEFASADARLVDLHDTPLGEIKALMRCEYVGLRQMWLVTEPLGNQCELRSRIMTMTEDLVRTHARSQNELRAFRIDS